MEITEETRRELFVKLREVLGVDDAEALMAHLPPVGWADVATRADLTHLEGQLRSHIVKARADLSIEISNVRTDVADLRTEIVGVRSELKEEIAGVRGELREEIAGVRNDMAGLRGELKDEIAELRTEVKDEITGLRTELKDEIAGVRNDMAGLRDELKGEIADVRTEIADLRTDLKDSFASFTIMTQKQLNRGQREYILVLLGVLLSLLVTVAFAL